MSNLNIAGQIQDDLVNAGEKASKEIEVICDTKSLKEFESKYIGKDSVFLLSRQKTKDVEPSERPIIGKALNSHKELIDLLVASKQKALLEKENQARYETEKLDLSSGTHGVKFGTYHLVTQTRRELEDIFLGMGYVLNYGPEVETDWHNFEALNFPPSHPAREMQDTLYVEAPNSETSVMRTHTSPVQVRTMLEQKPPIYTIVTGRVYRNEALDARHLPVFHQLEGLAVDENITFKDLKGTIETFVRELLGDKTKIRMLPSFFPFTEPSAEFASSCPFCDMSGCRVCSHTGWIEIGGCGMVDPNVFDSCGIDTEKYTGFAFGFGIDRIAQIKYGLNELRMVFDNDQRFLKQF
ncbi:MAG: phenylalanine--tRNA ligase subunit alpha [Acidimicrobiia bacterium]|nr:phenylalanine--tRNA ligase subunit alpha [Acidimicrobiia bacterium]